MMTRYYNRIAKRERINEMFEVFNKRRQHCNNSPAISIAKWGKLAFNKPASDFLKDKGFKTVVLLFDSDNGVIGIRKPRGYDEAEYKLSNSQLDTYLVFCSPSFLKHIKYPLSQTKMFTLTWDEKEQMYLVNLPPIWKS